MVLLQIHHVAAAVEAIVTSVSVNCKLFTTTSASRECNDR